MVAVDFAFGAVACMKIIGDVFDLFDADIGREEAVEGVGDFAEVDGGGGKVGGLIEGVDAGVGTARARERGGRSQGGC